MGIYSSTKSNTKAMRVWMLMFISLCAVGFLLLIGASVASADTTEALDATDLIISEIMYNPTGGDDYEFIEIHNPGTMAVSLAGLSLSFGITHTFAADTIAPGGYYVVAKNPPIFNLEYGFPSDNTVPYIGKLGNGGEKVRLLNTDGSTIMSVEYDDMNGWPAAADGSGFSIVPVDPNGPLVPDNPIYWRASSGRGGSPGAEDPASTIRPVYVNEIMAHTDLPDVDWIELYNPNPLPVDISGWYLTDDRGVPMGYQFPPGTTIPGMGYISIDETTLGFGFSSAGESAYLFSADALGLTGFSHGFDFGPSFTGVSFGRHIISTGEERLTSMASTTRNQFNGPPAQCPIVIASLMYQPDISGNEFIEIYNVTGDTQPLYDPANPSNPWMIDGVGTFGFPAGATLPPMSGALIVGMDPIAFRTIHSVPTEIQIFGPYTGSLNNDGERIELLAPDTPLLDGSVPYVTCDAVEYSDDDPWPDAANGGGASLQRRDLFGFGDDPINWQGNPNWDQWDEQVAITLQDQSVLTDSAELQPLVIVAAMLTLLTVSVAILEKGRRRA